MSTVTLSLSPPMHAHVLYNAAALHVQLTPALIGPPLAHACATATHTYITHVHVRDTITHDARVAVISMSDAQQAYPMAAACRDVMPTRAIREIHVRAEAMRGETAWSAHAT